MNHETIEDINAQPPHVSNARVAERVGVSKATVHKYRKRSQVLHRRDRPSAVSPNLFIETSRPERVLFVSDFHVPFHCKDSWEALVSVVKSNDFDMIVLGGDLFDCYSVSSHEKDPSRARTIQDEFDEGRELWRELDEVAPNSRIYYIEGNHEQRIRRLQSQNPGLFSLRSMELPIAADMPKRWRFFKNQSRIKIGPLSILHGDIRGRGGGGKHVAKNVLEQLRTPVVFGHHHQFQDHYETHADGEIRAAFATGCMCVPASMDYITMPNWQNGFRTIEFKWPDGIFAMRSHLIINGQTLYEGECHGRA